MMTALNSPVTKKRTRHWASQRKGIYFNFKGYNDIYVPRC